jgi:hypothetical protein
MRYGLLTLTVGIALGAVACSDAVTSRIAAPSDASASKNPYTGPGAGREKVTICHAAGRAGTTHYVEITVGAPAQYGHIDEHGTPQAGHEEDYYTTQGSGCGQNGSFTKKLIDVMIFDAAGNMITDPVYALTGNVVVPAGQTRWLEYELDYSLPGGLTGTITENETAVCNTLGAADVNHSGEGTISCSFNYGDAQPTGSMNPITHIVSWGGIKLTGSVLVAIDLASGGVFCGKRVLVNTAVLTLSNGQTLTAVSSTPVEFTKGLTGTCTRH